MLSQGRGIGANGEAEEEQRGGAEGEDGHHLRPAPPLEEQILAEGDEKRVHAPSANPIGSAPCGSGSCAAAPANTRPPASRTRPRSQSLRPRAIRCVAISTVLPSARSRWSSPSTRTNPAASS